MRALVTALFLAAALPYVASAQTGQSSTAETTVDRYRVFLLTMDQGDAVWERFGHNALLIEDRLSGDRLAWNWGLFDFQAEDFMLRFARGTMPFSMGPADLEPFVASYAAANRSVYANEVYLTQDEAAALDEFVRWNFQPENREYVYDYFLDNCSTRVRDALDGVLGGVIQQALQTIPTEYSYRWQVRRAARGVWWVDQGLNLLMGLRTDRPLSAWEASFLPVEFLEHATTIERPGPDGEMVPLIGPRSVLFQAERATVPTEPTGFSILWVAAGMGVSLGILALGRAARTGHSWARPFLGATLVLWGIVAGLLSLLLTAIWFTAHEFGHWNVNLLYLTPFAWVLAAAAVWATVRGLRPGRRSTAALALVAVVLAGLSLLAAVLQISTIVRQDNLEVLAVALPINVAAAMAAWGLHRSAESTE